MENHSSFLLLRKAVFRHLKPAVSKSFQVEGSQREIVHGVRMPFPGDKARQCVIDIPNSHLRLYVPRTSKGNLLFSVAEVGLSQRWHCFVASLHTLV